MGDGWRVARQATSGLMGTALLVACGTSASDAVFDLDAISTPPLEGRVLATREGPGGVVTEELEYLSEIVDGRRIVVFALFSYPKGGKRLPAFVWNQGGLAPADDAWTEHGARRGYATLSIDFPEPGGRSTPAYRISSGLELGDDPRDAPIYHGAVALLRAVSYLETREEVDPDRIGMAGSSWGGFFATLMAGVDSRLRACASMFGTGSLHVANGWWDGPAGTPPQQGVRERWRTTLDPAWRLPRSSTALAWFTGTNDSFYPLPAVQATYQRANAPKHLTLVPNRDHTLPKAVQSQVLEWLDVHLQGAPPFVEMTPLRLHREHRGTMARWSYHGPRRVVAAELIFTPDDDRPWNERKWVVVPARLIGEKASATLPAGSGTAAGTVIDERGFRYSTAVLAIEPGR